jgi:hypothetical protein
MTHRIEADTSAHALLSVFVENGIDRVFLVPGESYLGLLDALNDFPQIDVVTCRHEAGAGFMACADGRLTRRPGVFIVSRGPGASNGSIAVHRDGTPSGSVNPHRSMRRSSAVSPPRRRTSSRSSRVCPTCRRVEID